MASLPAELHANRGLLHDASRAYRRRDKNEEAYQILLKTPAERGTASAPEQWWSERHTLARDALKDKRYQLAYDMVSRHGLVSGGGFADAEFLSGWIALRYLNKPDAALKHFQTLAGGVSLPISVARAYYWSGRAEEALQHPNEAIAHYRRAAQNGETFYGQLALARVEEAPVLRLPASTHVVTRADEAAFDADERVGVIRMLSEARDRNLARAFAVRIANDDPPDAKKLQMLSQLMTSLGDPAMGVRVAKVASYNGVMLLSHLAPVVTLPRFPGTAAGPDPALVLGVTRQESEFDPAVVSSAGARGLMQLMPATAQRAASMNRLGFRLGDLTTNPRYNMQLGMVTLDDYLAYWGELVCARHRVLQRGSDECAQMGRGLWRSAGFVDGPDRLDRKDPVLGDPQLCAARARECRGVSQPPQRERSAARDSIGLISSEAAEPGCVEGTGAAAFRNSDTRATARRDRTAIGQAPRRPTTCAPGVVLLQSDPRSSRWKSEPATCGPR